MTISFNDISFSPFFPESEKRKIRYPRNDKALSLYFLSHLHRNFDFSPALFH